MALVLAALALAVSSQVRVALASFGLHGVKPIALEHACGRLVDPSRVSEAKQFGEV